MCPLLGIVPSRGRGAFAFFRASGVLVGAAARHFRVIGKVLTADLTALRPGPGRPLLFFFKSQRSGHFFIPSLLFFIRIFKIRSKSRQEATKTTGIRLRLESLELASARAYRSARFPSKAETNC